MLKTRGKVLKFASAALKKGDSVIIDRCNFNQEQRRHWTKLAEEIEFDREEVEAPECEVNEADNNSKCSATNNSTKNSSKRIFKLCLVLPKWNDVQFCVSRAISRGDDGVHEAGTDWSVVCRRIKKDCLIPCLVEEAFDALHVCTNEEDVNRTIQLLTNSKG